MIDKYGISLDGVAGITFAIASTAAAQNFSAAQMSNINGCKAIGCVITCEGESIRFAYNVDPIAGPLAWVGALGHVLFANQSMVIQNSNSIANFRFLSLGEQSPAQLMVTMYYEIGA